ncbi:RICIN domain-containing protein [Streptomyces sp. MUM 2J]|uniref:RICIN domain-containing protein n=1 Tax=Streptomyces sp. MUM 2J TaxID=2791987 RepID=UPI001F0365D7|nr:RICIN domain-containing protein [Streptomyces sp. MUM 2J]MCH0566456.1 hypothetical protein [Streptomyces sp. MUM 2J]
MTFTSVQNGKLLDVQNGSTADNAPVSVSAAPGDGVPRGGVGDQSVGAFGVLGSAGALSGSPVGSEDFKSSETVVTL